MDGDLFENAPRVDADIFYTDKKDAFSNYPDTCGRGLIQTRKIFSHPGELFR